MDKRQEQADGKCKYRTENSECELTNEDCFVDDISSICPLTQTDGDIITALCSLPKIISEDGQDYVQLADVLETVRRYKPSVAIPNKTGHWIKYGKLYQCSECKELSCCQGKFCNECGCPMEIDIDGMASDKLTTEDGEPDGVGQFFCP